MAPSSPSPNNDNLPDASGLVIAAKEDSPDAFAAANTPGRQKNMASRNLSRNRDRSGSSSTSDNPHEYDRNRDNVQRSLEEQRDQTHQQQPPRSVGFWDPSLRKVRKTVVSQWAAMILFLMCAIMAVLSLFWADFFVVSKKMRNLKVHVVDFDGQAVPPDAGPPLVGPTIVEIAEAMMQDTETPSLGYITMSPSAYDNDPIAVRQAVYDWECFAAIIIGAEATGSLERAARAGNASWDPAGLGGVQFVIQTARLESTYNNYVVPQLERLSQRFAAAFGERWVRRLMANETAFPRDALARAPAAVNPGVAPTVVDLRPFQLATATPAVTIGLIYLIIMAFFSFGFFMPIHSKYLQPHGHPPLHFWQYIVWRLCATIMAYFFISLAYSLVPLAFQVPFSRASASATETAYNATAYGRGSFPVYWMVNFVGMNALGMACENVAMVIGMPWTALWLIFWVITNVSTSFYPLELAPGFFHWGRAWPLFHIVQATRHILFDLHSHIGLDFGVLFSWSAVNVAFFPFCCYFMRWKMMRAGRKAQNDKDKDTVTTEDEQTDGNGSSEAEEKGAKPPKRKRGFMRGI